jgi:hypothetical protein
MDYSKLEQELGISCDVSAIDPAKRAEQAALAEGIFASVLEVKELANGYGFRLPLEASMIVNLGQWIAYERLCCPFFTFTIVIGEALWLELSGTPEVKVYIKAVIVDSLQQTGQLPDMEAWIAMHGGQEQ